MKTEKQNRFENSQRDIILSLLDSIGNDGHTIYHPRVLDGLPADVVERFTRTVKSDMSDYKQTIFKNGVAQKSVTGVYGLDVLEVICSDLGLSVHRFHGRGSQAQACTAAIRTHFKK